MKFKVQREHVGDKHYKSGEERELREQDAKELIANGVLEDPNNPLLPDDHIPDDWNSLKADAMKALAKSLGGEDIKTRSDAETLIQLKLEERESASAPTIEERDCKFVVVTGDEQVGEPYDTNEAAEAALAELGNE